MNEKVLVSFSSYNSPVFLEHLVESIEKYDAGYPFDLLILDNSSTDSRQLKALERFAKKYKVEVKPNYGRAQGGYDYAYRNNPNYAYHFFLHDDSAIIRNNWLKVGIDRINDKSLESVIDPYNDSNVHLCGIHPFSPMCRVGKVGYQGYEWGSHTKYFRTKRNQIFYYMQWIDCIKDKVPAYYQHLNDDRLLYTKECLDAIYKGGDRIYNIEYWKQMENSELWNSIHTWFKEANLHNEAPFAPNDRYGSNYNTFQTISEFLNDTNPIRHEFRTHCLLGDGYSQEDLGWSKFWGNEYIVHYGDHVVFKRLSLLFKSPEEQIRAKFKDKSFLTICDNIIKKEVENAK